MCTINIFILVDKQYRTVDKKYIYIERFYLHVLHEFTIILFY